MNLDKSYSAAAQLLAQRAASALPIHILLSLVVALKVGLSLTGASRLGARSFEPWERT